jgi:hypothetical protein
MIEDPTFLPVPGLWHLVRDGGGRVAVLARRIGLTRATASIFTIQHNPPLTSDRAALILSALAPGAVASCSGRALAAFAEAHPRPIAPGLRSGTAVAMISREMGRTGLPLDAAWRRVTDRLARDRGGASVTEVRRIDGTTFVLVRDSLRASSDPAGLRAVYAWRSTDDGPALGGSPEPPGGDPAPPDSTPTAGGDDQLPSTTDHLSRRRRFMCCAS